MAASATLFEELRPDGVDLPVVSFYPGAEGFRQAYELSLSATNEFLGCIAIQIMGEILGPAYINNYFKRRAEKGIRSRIIWPRSNLARGLLSKATLYKFQARFLAPDPEWQAGFLSWNDSLAILSLRRGHAGCMLVRGKAIAYFDPHYILFLCE